MRRKLLFVTLGCVIFIIGYFLVQHFWLARTTELPYRNLVNVGTGSCYIAFNVKNRDSVFTLVMPNLFASHLVRKKNQLLYSFYSLYMKEVIAHDLSIEVDDSLFSEFSIYVVDPDVVKKRSLIDLRNDSTIFRSGNNLRFDLSHADVNAIVYLTMKRGGDCCKDDFSGATMIFDE